MLFRKGWIVEGVLRGLLFCKTNDAVKELLLPVVVYAREGKEEERLGWVARVVFL